ncbi:hypothetical protein HDU93_001533 [Gonapodya sp. JEL0774]|nr:hypothetical protein HDU93_001533 [Gonapodya sp. JEL0774]
MVYIHGGQIVQQRAFSFGLVKDTVLGVFSVLWLFVVTLFSGRSGVTSEAWDRGAGQGATRRLGGNIHGMGSSSRIVQTLPLQLLLADVADQEDLELPAGEDEDDLEPLVNFSINDSGTDFFIIQLSHLVDRGTETGLSGEGSDDNDRALKTTSKPRVTKNHPNTRRPTKKRKPSSESEAEFVTSSSSSENSFSGDDHDDDAPSVTEEAEPGDGAPELQVADSTAPSSSAPVRRKYVRKTKTLPETCDGDADGEAGDEKGANTNKPPKPTPPATLPHPAHPAYILLLRAGLIHRRVLLTPEQYAARLIADGLTEKEVRRHEMAARKVIRLNGMPAKGIRPVLPNVPGGAKADRDGDRAGGGTDQEEDSKMNQEVGKALAQNKPRGRPRKSPAVVADGAAAASTASSTDASGAVEEAVAPRTEGEVGSDSGTGKKGKGRSGSALASTPGASAGRSRGRGSRGAKGKAGQPSRDSLVSESAQERGQNLDGAPSATPNDVTDNQGAPGSTTSGLQSGNGRPSSSLEGAPGSSDLQSLDPASATSTSPGQSHLWPPFTSNRLRCPIPLCTLHWGNIPGLKWHSKNYVHDAYEVLRWCFPAKEQELDGITDKENEGDKEKEEEEVDHILRAVELTAEYRSVVPDSKSVTIHKVFAGSHPVVGRFFSAAGLDAWTSPATYLEPVVFPGQARTSEYDWLLGGRFESGWVKVLLGGGEAVLEGSASQRVSSAASTSASASADAALSASFPKPSKRRRQVKLANDPDSVASDLPGSTQTPAHLLGARPDTELPHIGMVCSVVRDEEWEEDCGTGVAFKKTSKAKEGISNSKVKEPVWKEVWPETGEWEVLAGVEGRSTFREYLPDPSTTTIHFLTRKAGKSAAKKTKAGQTDVDLHQEAEHGHGEGNQFDGQEEERERPGVVLSLFETCAIESRYIAVGGYLHGPTEHHTMDRSFGPNSIQIWRCGDSVTDLPRDRNANATGGAIPVLEMCILHEYGIVRDLRWCSYGNWMGGHELEDVPRELRKRLLGEGSTGPIFAEVTVLGATLFHLAWGGHEKIAIGCSDGGILVASVAEAIRNRLRRSKGKGKGPAGFEHTNSSDGYLVVTDERDPHCGLHLFRVRGFLSASHWAAQENTILFGDADCTVRLARIGEEDPKRAKEDDMAPMMASRTLMGHKGHIWDISSSVYTPFAVSCSVDGTVRMANWNRLGDRRHVRPIVVTFYKLGWEGERVYMFQEELNREVRKSMSKESSNYKSGGQLNIFPETVAIQKDKENIWTTLLASAASSRQTPTRNVIVLGDAESGKSTIIAAIKSANPADAHVAVKPAPGTDLALSFSYMDLREEEGSLVVITLDWKKPWNFVESCERWLSILRNRVTEIAERNPEVVDECKRALESFVRSYSDPSDSVPNGDLRPDSPLPVRPPPSPVKQPSLPGSSLATGVSVVPTSSPVQPALAPMPEGCLLENLGIPIVIVCTKSDTIGLLEREVEYREEHFDFIQQALRTLCLRYGASLVYTSTSKPHTSTALRSYILHRLLHQLPPSTASDPSSGTSSPRQLPSFPFLRRAQVVDRDAVLVPTGWDSWGKIRVLRDGFDCPSAADTGSGSPQSSIDGGSGARDYFSSVVKKPVEKLVIPNPTIAAEDDQAFLERHIAVLGDGTSSGRGSDSLLLRTTSSNSYSGDLGPKSQSLRAAGITPTTNPTAAAPPGAQTEMIENFFKNLLIKKTGGRAASMSSKRPEDANR